jgi:ribonuclease HI
MKEITLYVDGSYSTKTPDVVGWGWCNEDESLYGKGNFQKDRNNPFNILSGRQVGGEIKAAMEAVKTAKDSGAENIIIMHDYKGIEKWATGKWKSNKVYTHIYAEWMQLQTKKIKISFKKVSSEDNKAHRYANEGLSL